MPTKNITSDTTRAIYLNSSQLEIDLSLRKQNYHRRVGFFFCLSALDGFLLLDVFRHSRISTVVTNFFHIMESGTQCFLLSGPAFIFFLLPGCNYLVWIDPDGSVQPEIFLEYFQQNSWSVSKAEAVVCDFTPLRSLHKQLWTAYSWARTWYLSLTWPLHLKSKNSCKKFHWLWVFGGWGGGRWGEKETAKPKYCNSSYMLHRSV